MMHAPSRRGHRYRPWAETVYNGVVIALGLVLLVLIVCAVRNAAELQQSQKLRTAQLWRMWSEWTTVANNVSVNGTVSRAFPLLSASRTMPVVVVPVAQTFYGASRPRHKRTFCFVIGAEGTGSTWMSKMLPADHKPPFNPKKGLTATIHQMWGSGPTARVRGATERLVEQLRHQIPETARLSALHVSSPDWDAHHYPDIHSLLWPAFYRAGLTLRVIVMVRDPAQAAHSNHRRQWKHLRVEGRQDVARSARSTEMHMTLLSEQVRTLRYPNDVLVVDYHRVMLEPMEQAERIARYLDLDATRTQQFALRLRQSRRPPSNYTLALHEDQVQYLRGFFDTERSAKWQYLRDRARA